MTGNTAHWLSSKRAATTLGAAPFPSAQSDELVIRTRAIAVNPMDRLLQTSRGLMTPYLHDPAILGSDVAGDVIAIGNEVGPMIFDTFLPDALADGRYVSAPAVEIAGHGLAAIPAPLERQRRGVSATKLVVTL